MIEEQGQIFLQIFILFTLVDMIELPNARTKIASDFYKFYKYLFMESGKNQFQMKRKELKLLS